MRIAVVLNTSWNIYNFRSGLIKSFLESGHQVIAIAPEDAYSHLLVEMGCIFCPVELENKGTNPWKDLKYTKDLYSIYKKMKPDIILQFTIKPNIYGTFAAQLLRIPVVNNVCGLGTVFLQNNFSSWFAKLLYRLSFRFPKKVFFQNMDDLALFLDKGLIKRGIADLVPGSGVALEKFKPLGFKRNSEFTFLMISRLIFDKGIIEFIEAVRILKSRGLQARFQLLGSQDDQDRQSVKKNQLDSWIKEGLIEYLGTSDNVASYIEKADCIVLPSYREGTPRALLESASMGKPLIATNVAGCRQTIDHRENGFLCEEKNPADLALQMEKMMQLEEDELKKMGEKSREKMEKEFDERFVIQKYQQILNEVDAMKYGEVLV